MGVLSLLLSFEMLGQSWFELANKHSPSVDAPVFDAVGVALAGTNYLAELWGAATADSLTPLLVIDQGNRRMIVPFVSNGYFLPTAGRLCVLSVPPGGQAWLEVRAWDARLGGTYEEAVSRGIGGYGESALFHAQGSNPFDLLGIPAALTGLESFNLRAVVPEPSAEWLFLLGAPWLFVRFRRFK